MGRILLAGASDGGSQAVMLSKLHSVARVVLFSSPVDAVYGLGGQAAAWLSKPGATPPDRNYGFMHVADRYGVAAADGWSDLGMAQFGPAVNVDSAGAPYSFSHMLTTALPVTSSAADLSTCRSSEPCWNRGCRGKRSPPTKGSKGNVSPFR